MISALRRVAARPHAIQRPRRNFSVFDWWRENVIKPIHGTRIKLPDVLGVPAATYMQFVYPVPVVVGGYYVMQWAIGRSHASIGPRGERLREQAWVPARRRRGRTTSAAPADTGRGEAAEGRGLT